MDICYNILIYCYAKNGIDFQVFRFLKKKKILFPYTKIYVEHFHPTDKSDNKINEFMQVCLKHIFCKVFW